MVQPPIDTFRAIAENAIDPIFVNDRSGCVVYANPAAERMFGFSAAEFAGARLHDLVHHHLPGGEPLPRKACAFSRAYTAGETVDGHIDTFVRKDGSFITMAGTIVPFSGADGWRGAVFFMRDVTARPRAQEPPAESEERFRLITNSMPQMVWVMSPDGTITYINERFREYIGPGVTLGKDYAAPVHPDDLPATKAAVEHALRAGTGFRIEHRGRAADGTYRWFLACGVPLKDANGRILSWYGSSTDIDDIRRAGDALRRSRETLRLAAELTNLGLWEYYPDTGELMWDETNRRNYGVPFIGAVDYDTFIARVHPDDRDRVDRAARKLMAPGSTGRFFTEYRIVRWNDGAERWVKVNGESHLDADGRTRFVGTTLDITDIKLAEERIRRAAQRDPLTGLPNRALLIEYCEHLFAIAQRSHSGGALLYIDLDRFKPINDTYGHGAGDYVLRHVARRLSACTRQEDIVGRIGGDEFVVALPHPDYMRGPATVARNIIERISEPYHFGDLQLQVSPSIGISLYPRHGTDLDALLKCADAAMYEAKKAGRNCYRFYNPVIDSGADQHLQLELRLRDAIDRSEFRLLYQPVMDLGSGAATGAEALLRLPMPDGGMLAPAQFLPVAEAAGLINRIGEWVAQEACRQHQQWREAGLPAISIAINVAPQQFRQRAFIRCLASSVEHSGMDPSCLQIELKESSVLEDVQETISALEEIRAIGIRVALDDFGVGYSSVRLLSSLPIDALKIDRSFVSGIGHDARSQVIADTVLALGRSLNLQVVGEGIETEDIVDYLRGHGCHQAQGYYFSGPLPADEFVRWYHDMQTGRQAMH